MRGSASVTIDAPPDQVYAVLSDVTQLGRLSPECYACEWSNEIAEAVPGATFTGHNRLGDYEWSTLCEITAAEPGRRLAFEAGSAEVKYTRWTYTLNADGMGTRVTESFEVLTTAPALEGASEERKAQRTAMLKDGMRQTLARLKAAVEGA